ncbi:HET domain-containing protein [Fusarium keratoplasticum]|uniref:HET domain-containing protein n=1 Tax=Fusarium keratoplasticum TaxID=1328300 RepID=A0ACC0QJL2_9HYPO|nr:HET domain-containing protein [Fusarium keratoplasticum]KAI8655143.1 HET domain-containing protein [Fusarium keratoplasticum]
MDDMQEKCGCRKPDITIFEICRSCGNPVNFEELRQQAIDTYDRDGRPIEDPNLPRRHLLIGNPRNSLRVLHLDDDASPILSGTFERASITHLPSYEAVSYCWGGDDGDYTKSEFIIIGGSLFPITKNCAAVLHKIRKTNSKRVIWIDSLCINQNDVKERSVQVRQMGQIFSGAQKVHIYLGNNVNNMTASKAFYVLNSMQNLHEFSMKLRNRAESVKALFTQTYFSRMWIIQEVLLAKSAALHWGTATIPWQTLSEGHLEEFKKSGIDSCIPEWMRIRATVNNFRNSETLGELLFSAMGSTASNDRDKVYGTYGLLFDAEEEGLTVDYSLSVVQVFTNMAAHLIKKHNALRAVLRHANHDAPLIDGEQLPSWVPDFRSRSVPKEVSISRGGLKDLEADSRITFEESIPSCGANELCLRGHRLTMPGLQRDSLTEYSTTRTRKPRVEIRAKFQVAFDPEDHTVFWMPDGALLQLKRHPTREDAYTFLGGCVIKHASTLPSFIFHYRDLSDAMYGLKLPALKSLWKLCMNLDCISHHDRIRLRLGSLKLPDTSMGWEKAEHVLNAYDFVNLLDRNRTPLEPDAQQMLHFLRFCQSDDTWEVLEKPNIGLKSRAWYSIQDISDLCLAWLQCYETAEYLIEQSSKITHEDSTLTSRLRSKFLNHLKVWEKTTEALSKALRWTEGSTWPFKTPPRFHKWDCDEDSKDTPDEDGKDTLRKKRRAEMILWPHQKPSRFKMRGRDEGKKAEDSSYGEEMRLRSIIRNNFSGVRLRFDLPVTATRPRDKRVEYVLEPWGEKWAGTIRSIPYLLTVGEHLDSIRSVGSRVKYSKQDDSTWKNLEVRLAETITLL